MYSVIKWLTYLAQITGNFWGPDWWMSPKVRAAAAWDHFIFLEEGFLDYLKYEFWLVVVPFPRNFLFLFLIPCQLVLMFEIRNDFCCHLEWVGRLCPTHLIWLATHYFQIKFYWNVLILISVLSVDVFLWQWQSWVVATEILCLAKPKTFLIWPLTEKCVDSCFGEMGLGSFLVHLYTRDVVLGSATNLLHLAFASRPQHPVRHKNQSSCSCHTVW